MNVGLHESRDDGAAGGLDDARRRTELGAHVAHRDDAIPFEEDVADERAVAGSPEKLGMR
jgi:hypothetical protein